MDQITREIRELLSSIPNTPISIEMKHQMENRHTRKAHFSELMKLAHRFNHKRHDHNDTTGCNCHSCCQLRKAA